MFLEHKNQIKVFKSTNPDTTPGKESKEEENLDGRYVREEMKPDTTQEYREHHYELGGKIITDWKKIFSDHRKIIEKGEREREEKIRRAATSWELLRTCRLEPL